MLPRHASRERESGLLNWPALVGGSTARAQNHSLQHDLHIPSHTTILIRTPTERRHLHMSPIYLVHSLGDITLHIDLLMTIHPMTTTTTTMLTTIAALFPLLSLLLNGWVSAGFCGSYFGGLWSGNGAGCVGKD